MNSSKGLNNINDSNINNDLSENVENKNDIFEEMEKGNLEDEFIKKGKKNQIAKNNHIFKYIFYIIIILIIFISFYFFSQNKKNRTDFNYEIYLKLKNKIDYKKNKIRNFRAHADFKAYSLSEFPCGNLIVHDDVLIIIYDNNLNELQQIYPFNADLLDKNFPKIIKIAIKDDNNFIFSTTEGNIKFYTKKENDFILKNEIKDFDISTISFDSKKEKLFALSNDSLIIFEENNNGDYLIKNKIPLSNLENYNLLFRKAKDDMLFLEDKNILIVKQINDIKFYDMKNNFKLINIFKDKNILSVERFGDDKLIIIGDYNILKIISIYENKIFNEIKINFELTDVKYIKDKGIIVLGGAVEISDRHMRISEAQFQILKGNNFELIQSISEEKLYSVYGINILQNGDIAVYYGDLLQIWNLKKIKYI